jgi:hypothetical protein
VLLADSVILVVGGLFIVGIVGFFLMLVVLIGKFFGFVFRALSGAQPAEHPRFQTRQEVCPHPRCGYVNRSGARYCARCGRPLSHTDELDAYG